MSTPTPKLAGRPRPLRPSLGPNKEPGYMHLLVSAFIVSFFIPKSVYLDIAGLQFSPLKIIGILLFAILVFGGHLRLRWPDLLMVGIFVYGFWLMFDTGEIGHAFERSGRLFLEGGMAYLIGRYVSQNLQRFLRTIRLAVLILSVMALGLILESLTRINVHHLFWGTVFQTQEMMDEKRLGLSRAMGWTVHPIMLGLTYATLFSITMHAALSKSNIVGKHPWLKTSMLAIGAFTSLSSGVWATILIVICLLSWERLVKLAPAQKWSIALVGIPTSYLVLELLSNRPLMRILMMKAHISSNMAWYYRWRLYERVMDSMPGHWWFGYGSAIPPAFAGASGTSIDNQYLLLLLTRGLVGLGLWIAMMLVVLFYRGRSVWFNRDSSMARLARAMGFTILAFMAAQFTVAVFSRASTLLWLSFGLMIGLSQLCADEARTPIRRRARPRRPARRGPTSPPKQPPPQRAPQPA